MTDLDVIWEAIENESAPGGVIRRRIEPESTYDLFLTQAQPSKARSFLAVFPNGPGTAWQALRSSRGLGIEVSESEGSASIQLTEREPRFRSIFNALVTDLVRGLRVVQALPAAERPTPLDFIAGRILRWQTCLQTGPEGLSDEKQAGLFGELKTLTHLLAGGMPPTTVVLAWTGPARSLQDFQHRTSSIEVKTSRQTKPTTLRISSERQLDTTAMARLFLLHFALEPRTDGAGDSLPQLVEVVRDLVGRDSDVGLVLDDRLLEYGYLDNHAPKYAALSYAVRAIDAFDVVDGFPRVVEGDLPPGVGDLSYALALSACEPFRVQPEEVWEYMTGEIS